MGEPKWENLRWTALLPDRYLKSQSNLCQFLLYCVNESIEYKQPIIKTTLRMIKNVLQNEQNRFPSLETSSRWSVEKQ